MLLSIFILSSKSLSDIKLQKDFGILALMYHRFNEQKYPSTNIKLDVFKKHVEEITKSGLKIINFNEFKKNSCAGTSFHGINILVDCVEENPQKFNLLTLRSFGESFYHHITDAALEFGYVGV